MLRWQWRCMPHSSLNFKGKCLESVRNSSAEFISHTLKRGPTFKGNSNEAVNPSIWYQNVQFFKFWESAQTEHGSHWGQRSQAQHYFNLRQAFSLKKKKKNVKGFLLSDILEMCLVTDNQKHFVCISSFYTRAKRLGICFVSCCSAFLLTVQSENNKQLCVDWNLILLGSLNAGFPSVTTNHPRHYPINNMAATLSHWESWNTEQTARSLALLRRSVEKEPQSTSPRDV